MLLTVVSRWGLVVVLLVSGAARAEQGQTDRLIDQASAHYAELDFEVALESLDEALRTPGNSRPQLIRIYHLQGLCQASLRRYDQAKESFARLLALDPAFRLGLEVAPRIRKPFEDLLASNPGRLDVRVKSPPAAVREHDLVFTAEVLADPASMAKTLRVWFQSRPDGAFQSVEVALAGLGEHLAVVPYDGWGDTGEGSQVTWYAVVEDQYGGRLITSGDQAHPLLLEVVDESALGPVWYTQWWVWAIAGGAVVIVGSAAAVMLWWTYDQQRAKEPVDIPVEISVQGE